MAAVASVSTAHHMCPRAHSPQASNNNSPKPTQAHVGAGTFLPVTAERTEQHHMHKEWGEVPQGAADAVNNTRRAGGRIVAIGTTALRMLESASDTLGVVRPFRGDTDLFIPPGYRLKAVDLLLTNFHLPRSSLLMLVAAFGGHALIMDAYRDAVRREFRFYSYGDAMLIL